MRASIIVTGSRTLTARDLTVGMSEVFNRLEQFLIDKDGSAEIALMHGDARGCDHLAHTIGRGRGYTLYRRPITADDWRQHGRAAGPLRNRAMAQQLASSDAPHKFVLAFIKGTTMTPGTWNMLQEATALDLPVALYNEEGERLDLGLFRGLRLAHPVAPATTEAA